MKSDDRPRTVPVPGIHQAAAGERREEEGLGVAAGNLLLDQFPPKTARKIKWIVQRMHSSRRAYLPCIQSVNAKSGGGFVRRVDTRSQGSVSAQYCEGCLPLASGEWFAWGWQRGCVLGRHPPEADILQTQRQTPLPPLYAGIHTRPSLWTGWQTMGENITGGPNFVCGR